MTSDIERTLRALPSNEPADLCVERLFAAGWRLLTGEPVGHGWWSVTYEKDGRIVSAQGLTPESALTNVATKIAWRPR